jgi:catechol 2,3-dioxygenase-like lactoylglutathione lyase family enzyme
LRSARFVAKRILGEEGDMLGEKEPIGTLAVKDLAVAKKFYQGTLGLKLEDETGAEAHTYRSGGARLIVYRSEFAGTNKATALNFIVGDDIDKLVKGLRDRGVTFEHYDGMPEVKRDGDIHIAGPMRIAWFKDPDGNILCLMNH